MFNCTFFAENFKNLRLIHYLSVSQLASLLHLKSKGSISALEANRSFPSFENLSDITNLFAVSMDWLAGRSDEPYTEKILLALEEKNLELLSTALEHDELRYFHISCSWPITTNPRYMNPTTRSEFSLPVRANIVYIMNWFYHTSIAFHVLDNPISSSIRDFHNFQQIILPSLIDNRGHKDARWKLSEQYHSYLKDILVDEKDIITPVFDISNPPE